MFLKNRNYSATHFATDYTGSHRFVAQIALIFTKITAFSVVMNL